VLSRRKLVGVAVAATGLACRGGQARPGVRDAAAGSTTTTMPPTAPPQHMADNMGAGRRRLPDEAQRRRMIALLE